MRTPKEIVFAGAIVFALASFASGRAVADMPVTIGSKAFTESFILQEIASQIIEKSGQSVVRKPGLGGTGLLFEALMKGDIDVYPEYTGTISEAILRDSSKKSFDEIKEALLPLGLTMSDSIGFNNTYAIAVRKDVATTRGLKKISDLRGIQGLKIALSHEFLNRPDGFPGLVKRYRLALPVPQGIEHSLAYEALASGQIDATDVYTTDSKIDKLGLVVLKDDLEFFPKYWAVLLARTAFTRAKPKAWAELRVLEGAIGDEEMRALNAESDLEKKSFSAIASGYLKQRISPVEDSNMRKVLMYTRQHLYLVGLSLLASILAGLPLGILASRFRLLGQAITAVSGLFQTIPSLALLCFLIPFFGIGTTSSLIALFLYGLLPIVVYSSTSLRTIDRKLLETGTALGLTGFQKLTLIELPLASPGILAGIKTSAIINIGTATLAALIGAGGYGTPIVTGLAVNDVHMILLGAVPAAVMALVAHVLFEGLNRILVPRGLRTASTASSAD